MVACPSGHRPPRPCHVWDAPTPSCQAVGHPPGEAATFEGTTHSHGWSVVPRSVSTLGRRETSATPRLYVAGIEKGRRAPLDSGVLRPGAAVPVTLSCPEWVLVPVRISGRGRGLSRPSALGGGGACVLDPPVGNPPGEPTPLRRAAHSHRLVSLSPFGLFVAALGARVCVLGHANLYVTGMGKGRRVWHEWLDLGLRNGDGEPVRH